MADKPQMQYRRPADTAGDPSDPYDRAAMEIHSPVQAQSRFTRTPITIHNPGASANDVLSKLRGIGVDAKMERSQSSASNTAEGSYRLRDKTIDVDLAGKPTWDEMQHAIHHEDTHALLDKYGVQDHSPPTNYYHIHKPMDLVLSHSPDEVAGRGFSEARRSGNSAVEMPAYMSAYKDGELPGVTPAIRQDWLHDYLPTLPAPVQQTLKRIMASDAASKRR